MQQQQQQQQGQQLVVGGLGQMDLAAIRELESLKDAFVPRPGNPRFRFHYLFLNVVDDPAQRIKPPGQQLPNHCSPMPGCKSSLSTRCATSTLSRVYTMDHKNYQDTALLIVWFVTLCSTSCV